MTGILADDGKILPVHAYILANERYNLIYKHFFKNSINNNELSIMNLTSDK